MTKNLADLRFAITRPDGYRSSVWRAWATSQSDVYLATRSMASIEKLSFHSSLICRRAFSSEHGTPPTMPDRLIHRWRRRPAPTRGEGTATRVAWIAFPTNLLSLTPSAPAPTPLKPIALIPAAPPDGATYVEVAFTRETEADVRASFANRGDRHLVLYQPLPNGEVFLWTTIALTGWTKTSAFPEGKGPRPSVLLTGPPGDGSPHPAHGRPHPQGRRRRRIKGDRWVRVVDAQPRANRCSLMPPNQRMHQSGRGRRFPQGWHGRTSRGRFPDRAAAPQVMRGR